MARAPGGLAALRAHAARAAAARGVAHRRQGVPGSRPRARGRGERGHELGRQRRGELLLLRRCARQVSRIRGGSPGSGRGSCRSNSTPLQHGARLVGNGIVGLCSCFLLTFLLTPVRFFLSPCSISNIQTYAGCRTVCSGISELAPFPEGVSSLQDGVQEDLQNRLLGYRAAFTPATWSRASSCVWC